MPVESRKIVLMDLWMQGKEKVGGIERAAVTCKVRGSWEASL